MVSTECYLNDLTRPNSMVAECLSRPGFRIFCASRGAVRTECWSGFYQSISGVYVSNVDENSTPAVLATRIKDVLSYS